MEKLTKNPIFLTLFVLLPVVCVSCSKSSVDIDMRNKAGIAEDKEPVPPLAQSFEWLSYSVQQNDTIITIAKHFGVRADVVIVCNDISEAWNLNAGDILRIPNMDGLIHRVKAEESIAEISFTYQVPEEIILKANDISGDSLTEGQLLFIPGANTSISQIIDNVGEYKVGDYIIKDVNGQIHILDYIAKKRKSVIIPETIENLSVIEIAGNAFSNKGLTSIMIPESVVNIGYNAFENNKLKSVTIPDSIRTIESMAFIGNNITHITIGSDVTLGRRTVFYDDGSVVDYGPFGLGFNGYYIVTGKRAGVYVYKNNFWTYENK